MIIISLGGGLGNQLFKYALGRSLSEDLNEELFIDLSEFNHNSARHEIYGLHSYNIKGVVGNYQVINNYSFFVRLLDFSEEFRNYVASIKPNFISKFLIFIVNFFQCFLYYYISRKVDFYYREPHIFSINSRYIQKNRTLKNIVTPAYIDGVFQFNYDLKNKFYISERFFSKYNNLIHDDLQYMLPLTTKSQKIVDDMKKYDSICLHVRHGDYAGILEYGLCSKEYYEKSINIIVSKVNNPKFFIFSDDIEGAKKIIKMDFPHEFVDFQENPELIARGNGELLKIMSSCKHFIIANSTLSWWAAFLGENENKLIITPEPWTQSRLVMGVETIDNHEVIKVINNNKELFNNSNNLIYQLNDDDFLFKNLKFDKFQNEYKILNIKSNSFIRLKNYRNKTYKRLIIKISLESNCYNVFRVFFKTKDSNKYDFFHVYYYEEDNFDQYIILPANAIIDGIKIKPGYPFESEEDYVIIRSFEIKEIEI